MNCIYDCRCSEWGISGHFNNFRVIFRHFISKPHSEPVVSLIIEFFIDENYLPGFCFCTCAIEHTVEDCLRTFNTSIFFLGSICDWNSLFIELFSNFSAFFRGIFFFVSFNLCSNFFKLLSFSIVCCILNHFIQSFFLVFIRPTSEIKI